MADPMLSVPEMTLGGLAKLGAGAAGSLISLRFLPQDASWLNRLTSFGGGVSAAVIIGPALADLASASVRIEYGIVFVAGLFGMAVAGELMSVIREMQLATIARDAIRKLLRLER